MYILIHVNQMNLVRINLYEEKGIQRMNLKKRKECNVEGKITAVQFYCAVTINYARVYILTQFISNRWCGPGI